MQRSRFRYSLRILVTATLVAASLAACSSNKPASPPAAAPARPTSAWQSVLNQIKPDGSVTTTTALSAFAMAIGPVPGAVVPAGTAQQIVSGSIAVRWVLRHWTDLSPAQQTAVLTDLGVSRATNQPASFVDSVPAQLGPPPNFPCQSEDTVGAAKFRTMLPSIEAAIAAKLGRPLSVASNTFIAVNTQQSNPTSLMYTVPCKDASAKVTGCTFHVNPLANGHSDDELRDYFIHEVMHCFMYARIGSVYTLTPDWYAEGQAAWAASVLGTANAELTAQWQLYLDHGSTSLVQRTSDGLGFFAHLAETGTNPWSVMDPMADALVANNTTASAWAKAGVTPAFLTSWGSGLVAGAYPGTAWNTGGPNLPHYAPSLPQAAVGNGGSLNLASRQFAPNAEQVDVTAEVLVVSADAGTSGRMTLGGGGDTTVDNPGPYCTAAKCSCPADSAGAGTTFVKMSPGRQYIGLTGGDQTGAVSLAGLSLADFCKKKNVACMVGQWTATNFEVHVNDITESGGAGVKLHIDKTGKLTAVFDGMKPVQFQESGGTQIAGSFVYNGSFTGVLKLPPATASSGPWTYTTSPNTAGISATVHLTSPIDIDLGSFDLSDLGATGGAGSAISSNPMAVGSWTCSGNTLTSQPPAGSVVQGVATLTRTGPG